MTKETEEVEYREIDLSVHTGARMGPIIAPILQNIAKAEDAEPEEMLVALLNIGVSGLLNMTEDPSITTDIVTGITADILHMYEEANPSN